MRFGCVRCAAHSKLATTTRPESGPTEYLDQLMYSRVEGKAKEAHVRYNARQDKFLRCEADDTLDRHAFTLSVPEPTVAECGGLETGDEPRLSVDGIRIARVNELIAHMKPFGDGTEKLSGVTTEELAAIRIIQAARMEFELNRLRILRKRRMELLLELDANRDGAFDRAEIGAVLKKLYGADAPTGGAVDELIAQCSPVRPAPHPAPIPPIPSLDMPWDLNGISPCLRTPRRETRLRLTAALSALRSRLQDAPAVTNISPRRLLLLLAAVNKVVRQAEAEAALSKFDGDGSGDLDKEEVLALLKQRSPGVKVTKGDVRVLFETADVDGSGAIDKKEMVALLNMWDEMVAAKPAKSSACVLL